MTLERRLMCFNYPCTNIWSTVRCKELTDIRDGILKLISFENLSETLRSIQGTAVLSDLAGIVRAQAFVDLMKSVMDTKQWVVRTSQPCSIGVYLMRARKKKLSEYFRGSHVRLTIRGDEFE